MALLVGGCDANVIKLLARWRSNAMMRYLHQRATPIAQKLATSMFHSDYSFLPDAGVPADPDLAAL